MGPDRVTPLGEKNYLGRTVETYQIHFDNGRSYEYWFDKETSMFMREIEISDGIRVEHSKLIEFKIIEMDRYHDLFDMTPPDGARVLTR